MKLMQNFWNIRKRLMQWVKYKIYIKINNFAMIAEMTLSFLYRLIFAGRPGQVSELADAISFLASDAASFITGASLPVDGGRHCMCPR